jgi:hypothetical protein
LLTNEAESKNRAARANLIVEELKESKNKIKKQKGLL